MVSRSCTQPLGMVSPGRENCQKQGQKGKVGKFWMISSIMGNGSIFRVAVEQKSHLWLPVSSLYREPSRSVPGGMLPLPEAELLVVCRHTSPSPVAIQLRHRRAPRAGVQNSAMDSSAYGFKWPESTLPGNDCTFWFC